MDQKTVVLRVWANGSQWHADGPPFTGICLDTVDTGYNGVHELAAVITRDDGTETVIPWHNIARMDIAS